MFIFIPCTFAIKNTNKKPPLCYWLYNFLFRNIQYNLNKDKNLDSLTFLLLDNFLILEEWTNYFLYINIDSVNEQPEGKCLTLRYCKKRQKCCSAGVPLMTKNVSLLAK